MAQEKSKLEKFEEIEALIRKASAEEALKVYKQEAAQYEVPRVPYHVHNGVDAPIIPEDNVFLTNKLTTQLDGANPGGPVTMASFTINGVPNISRVSFHGFAANNASAPATIRSHINGEAIFGRCYGFTGVVPTIVVTTTNQGLNFVQASNGITIDTAAIANTRVFDAPYLASMVDSTTTSAALSAQINAGSTSGTLSGAWGGSTGSYITTFSAVDTAQSTARLVSFTNASTSISWTGGLPYRVQTPLTVGIKAILYLDSYINNTLSFTFGLDADWRINGILIIE